MMQKCLFHLFQDNRDLGYRKGVCDMLRQIGAYKSGFTKTEAVGISRGTKVYYSGKKGDVPTLVVDASTHLTSNYGKSMKPDPELIEVLNVACEDKLWKYLGSVNVCLWQMLALMGAGAGVLGGVLLVMQMITANR